MPSKEVMCLYPNSYQYLLLKLYDRGRSMAAYIVDSCRFSWQVIKRGGETSMMPPPPQNFHRKSAIYGRLIGGGGRQIKFPAWFKHTDMSDKVKARLRESMSWLHIAADRVQPS